MNFNNINNWINSIMAVATSGVNTVIGLVKSYKSQAVMLALLIAGGWAMAKGSKMFSVNTKLNIGKK